MSKHGPNAEAGHGQLEWRFSRSQALGPKEVGKGQGFKPTRTPGQVETETRFGVSVADKVVRLVKCGSINDPFPDLAPELTAWKRVGDRLTFA